MPYIFSYILYYSMHIFYTLYTRRFISFNGSFFLHPKLRRDGESARRLAHETDVVEWRGAEPAAQ